jgi:hypothetical protein
MTKGRSGPKAAAPPAPTPSDRKAEFVKALAEFLVGNQAGKGIALEVEHRTGGGIIKWAQEWAKLRNATPLFGYLTVEEAEKELTEFLR